MIDTKYWLELLVYTSNWEPQTSAFCDPIAPAANSRSGQAAIEIVEPQIIFDRNGTDTDGDGEKDEIAMNYDYRMGRNQ